MGRIKRKRPASTKKKRKREAAKGNTGPQGLKPVKVETSLGLEEVAPGGSVGIKPARQRHRPGETGGKSVANAVKPSGKKFQIGFLSKSGQFLREVKMELKKVTWPSRKETVASTAVVIVLVIIVSAFLGLVDVSLSGLIRLILR